MIALCIGHSRRVNGSTEGGSYSVDGVSEHQYWSEVAPLIAEVLERQGQPVTILDDYHGNGYVSAMQWVAAECKRMQAKCAIELHFNGAHPLANGHEWLYWHSSKRGIDLAALLDSAFQDRFTGLIKRRGLKAIGTGGRGAHFLRLTPCPAVIAEPFFGSHEGDWKIAVDMRYAIASCIAEGVLDWLEG